MYIKRVGDNNALFTKGAVYKVNSNSRVVADDGSLSSPVLDSVSNVPREKRKLSEPGDYNDYWEVVEAPKLRTYSDMDLSELEVRLIASRQLQHTPFNIEAMSKAAERIRRNELFPLNKGEAKMLAIKDAVLINGRDSDEYSDQDLINYIKAEQDKIKQLDEVKVNSKAINNLRIDHMKVVDKLVTILDSRVEKDNE